MLTKSEAGQAGTQDGSRSSYPDRAHEAGLLSGPAVIALAPCEGDRETDVTTLAPVPTTELSDALARAGWPKPPCSRGRPRDDLAPRRAGRDRGGSGAGPTCSIRGTRPRTSTSSSAGAWRSARSPPTGIASSTRPSTCRSSSASWACSVTSPRSAAALALEDSEVWRAGGPVLLDFLIEEPAAARSLLRALARQVLSQEAFVEDLLYLDLKGRVAKRLLQLVSPSLDELPGRWCGRAVDRDARGPREPVWRQSRERHADPVRLPAPRVRRARR